MTADPLGFQVFNEVGIIDQLASAMFTRALPKGMTIAQFTVLNHFVRLDPGEKSPAALASAFQVTRPTMTSTLTRMARSGMINIRDDPHDGRAKLVSITSTGRTMRETCVAATATMMPRIADVVSDEDFAAILPALKRIRVALDALRDG
jgi:DNA-binding MarR family transcriptional regulator